MGPGPASSHASPLPVPEPEHSKFDETMHEPSHTTPTQSWPLDSTPLPVPEPEHSKFGETMHERLPTTPTQSLPFYATEPPQNLGVKEPVIHLVSHRSCSQDRNAKCNEKLHKELQELAQLVSKKRRIKHSHIFYDLPDEIQNDPRWAKHVVCPKSLSNLKIASRWNVSNLSAYTARFLSCPRGRGYWFWKPAIVNMLVRTGVVRNGEFIFYVEADQGPKHFNQLLRKGRQFLLCKADVTLSFGRSGFANINGPRGRYSTSSARIGRTNIMAVRNSILLTSGFSC